MNINLRFLALFALLASLPGSAQTTKPTESASAGQLVAQLPDTEGFYNLTWRGQIEGHDVSIPARVYLPRGYDKGQERFPVALYLHDDAQRGSDLKAVAGVGFERALRNDGGMEDRFRCIAVTPQCPGDRRWTDAAMRQCLVGLIDAAAGQFRVDRDRIFIGGTGSGASGALQMVLDRPTSFAGLMLNSLSAPISGGDGRLLRHVAVWISASDQDKPAVSAGRQSIESLHVGAGEPQWSVRGANRTECEQQFFADGKTCEWLGARRRTNEADRTKRDAEIAKRDADALAHTPKIPGFHPMMFETWMGDQRVQIPYLVFLPIGYDKGLGGKDGCPTLVFMHGAGEGARDLQGIYGHGPASFIKANAAFAEWCPMVILSPIHQPNAETAAAISRMLDDAKTRFRIDPDRVYVSGLSLGGTGTWAMAMASPEKFAAAAPICGRAYMLDQVGQRLRNLPIWTIVGGADGDFFKGTTDMTNALRKAGDEVQLSVVPNEGHGVWPRYFGDRRFYDRLMQFRRGDKFVAADKTPTAPGHYWRTFKGNVGGKTVEMKYGLYLPKGYDGDGADHAKWPMLVSLHNEADRCSDLSMVFNWGADVDPRRPESELMRFGMIGIAPQCPFDKQWTDQDVQRITLALLDEVKQRYAVDVDRIYLTGRQMGSAGTWALATTDPDRFAAIAPVQTPAPENAAAKLRGMAIYEPVMAGDDGNIKAARARADGLRRQMCEVRLQIVPNPPGKDAEWRPSFADAAWEPYYTEPALCEWLMAHRRLSQDDRRKLVERSNEKSRETLEGGKPVAASFAGREDSGINRVEWAVLAPSKWKRSAERSGALVCLAMENEPTPMEAMAADTDLLDATGMIVLKLTVRKGQKPQDIADEVLATLGDATERLNLDEDRIELFATAQTFAAASILRQNGGDRLASLTLAASMPPDIGDASPQSLRGAPITVVVAGEKPDMNAWRAWVDQIKKCGAEARLAAHGDNDGANQKLQMKNPGFYEWIKERRRS